MGTAAHIYEDKIYRQMKTAAIIADKFENNPTALPLDIKLHSRLADDDIKIKTRRVAPIKA